MVSSAAELKSLSSRIQDRLDSLADRKTYLVDKSNPFVRGLSNWVSGAGKHLDTYSAAFQKGKTFLDEARKCLDQGRVADAEQKLIIAGRFFDRAELFWKRYVSATSDGAEDVVTTLTAVRNGSAAFVVGGVAALTLGASTAMAGALAASTGLHAGFFSLFPSLVEPSALADTRNQPMEGVEMSDTSPRNTKLIAEAQRRLQEWKDNPRLQQDHGNFFLEAEWEGRGEIASADLRDMFRSQWADEVQRIKSEAKLSGRTVEEQIIAVMRRLYEDYLPVYSRDLAGISDFFEGRGGNCEAQAILILAAMTAAEIDLPEPLAFGIQRYGDHMDAVLYNKTTRETWNLLTGQKTRRPLDTIYAHPVLYQAFLHGVGGSSPVADKELLLDPAEDIPRAKGRAPSYQTNSRLSFPPGRGNSGPAPERAYLQSPYGGTVRNGLGTHISESGSIITIPQGRREELLVEMGDLDFVIDSLTKKPFFRYPEQSHHYNQLPDNESKREFLFQLTRQGLTKKMTSPAMTRGFTLLSDLSQARKFSAPDLRETVNAMEETLNTHTTAVWTMAKLFPKGTDDPEGYKTRDALDQQVRERIPLFRLLIEKKEALNLSIVEQPIEFVVVADRLDHAQRKALLRIFDFLSLSFLDSNWEPFNPPTGQDAVVDLLIDPTKIVVEEERPPLEVFEVVFEDPSDSPDQREWKSGDLPKKSEGPRRISAESMIDFLFELNYSDLWEERWNPKLSRAILRLNHDGRYDSAFLELYHDINRTYPHHQRSVPIPQRILDLEAWFYQEDDGNPDHGKVTKALEEYGRKVSADLADVLEEIYRNRARLHPIDYYSE